MRFILCGFAVAVGVAAAQAEETTVAMPTAVIPFQKQEHWGYRTIGRDVRIAARFDAVTQFSEGWSLAQDGDNVVLIDTQGRARDLGQGAWAHVLSKTHVAIGSAAGVRLVAVDQTLRQAPLPGIGQVSGTAPGDAVAVRLASADAWGIVDLLGERLSPFTFAAVGAPRFGLAPFAADFGKWGYITTTGQQVLPPILWYAGSFSAEGLALAADGSTRRMGYIDRNMKFFQKPDFFQAMPFSSGVAWVRDEQGRPWRCVDANLKPVFPATFQSVKPFVADWAAVVRAPEAEQAGGLRADTLISKSGEIIYEATQPRHDIVPTTYGYAWVNEQRALWLVLRDGTRVEWGDFLTEIPPEQLLLVK